MKVILVGHGCHPRLGSEPGLTWNWAWHLSKDHEIWLITHPWSRDVIDKHLEENPNPNLHFVWVTVPKSIDPWNPENERFLRLHYIAWQRNALRAAIEIHRAERCDLVHHVCWGTLNAPPLLWRLPIPFIWGPLGGGQSAPGKLRRYFGRSWALEIIRTARLNFVSWLPALSRAARKSALVLATNQETATRLTNAGARSVTPFLDNGLTQEFLPSPRPTRRHARSLSLLWAGRIEARKALPLALEAISMVPSSTSIKLIVAGDGPQKKQCEELAIKLGIQAKTEFLGMVPRTEMLDLFRAADAFIFTSLRDAFGSVVLEAAGQSLPIITLDHQGVGCFLPPEAGIKVVVSTPEETALSLAKGIQFLAESPEARQKMSEAAYKFALSQRWDLRAKQMSIWYGQVVHEHSHI